jgi:radical SAM protein with 4Fe4S-binding SPASM domain
LRCFRLKPDVFFEQGARGAALYDITRQRILPLTEHEASAVRLCQSNIDLEALSLPSRQEVLAVYARLESLNLGVSYPNAVYVEPYIPTGTGRVPGLIEPPLKFNVVHLQLTSTCEADCAGCGRRDAPVWQACNGCERWPAVAEHRWKESEMDSVLDQLIGLDIVSVFFSGGNPLSIPNVLLRAIRRLREPSHPINVVVTTFGGGLDASLADEFSALGVRLNLVLGGAAEIGLAAAVSADGTNAMSMCRQRGVNFNATTVVHHQTAAVVETARQSALAAGAQRVFVSQILDSGAGFLNRPRRRFAEVAAVSCQDYFSRREQNPCLHGTLAIAADGGIRPCPAIPLALGDIYRDGLRTILRERRHERFWGMTKDCVPVCSSCEFRRACVDCTAVDIAKNARPELHSALCCYDPLTAQWPGD